MSGSFTVNGIEIGGADTTPLEVYTLNTAMRGDFLDYGFNSSITNSNNSTRIVSEILNNFVGLKDDQVMKVASTGEPFMTASGPILNPDYDLHGMDKIALVRLHDKLSREPQRDNFDSRRDYREAIKAHRNAQEPIQNQIKELGQILLKDAGDRTPAELNTLNEIRSETFDALKAGETSRLLEGKSHPAADFFKDVIKNTDNYAEFAKAQTAFKDTYGSMRYSTKNGGVTALEINGVVYDPADFDKPMQQTNSLSTPANEPVIENPVLENFETEASVTENVETEAPGVEDVEVEEITTSQPKGFIDIREHIAARTENDAFTGPEMTAMAQSMLVLMDINANGENSAFYKNSNDSKNIPDGRPGGAPQAMLDKYKQENGLDSNEAAFQHMVDRMDINSDNFDPEFANAIVDTAIKLGEVHDTFEGQGYNDFETRAEDRNIMAGNKYNDIVAQQFLLEMFEFTGDYDGKYDGSNAQTRVVDGDFGIETRERLDFLKSALDDARRPEPLEIERIDKIDLTTPIIGKPDIQIPEDKPNAQPVELGGHDIISDTVAIMKGQFDAQKEAGKVGANTYRTSSSMNLRDNLSELSVDEDGELQVTRQMEKDLEKLGKDVLGSFKAQFGEDFSEQMMIERFPELEALQIADGKQGLSNFEVGAYFFARTNVGEIGMDENGNINIGELQTDVTLDSRGRDNDHDGIDDRQESLAFALEVVGARKGIDNIEIGKAAISDLFNANAQLTHEVVAELEAGKHTKVREYEAGIRNDPGTDAKMVLPTGMG